MSNLQRNGTHTYCSIFSHLAHPNGGAAFPLTAGSQCSPSHHILRSTECEYIEEYKAIIFWLLDMLAN